MIIRLIGVPFDGLGQVRRIRARKKRARAGEREAAQMDSSRNLEGLRRSLAGSMVEMPLVPYDRRQVAIGHRRRRQPKQSVAKPAQDRRLDLTDPPDAA